MHIYIYIYRAQEEYNHTQKRLRDETDELRDTTYHLSDIKLATSYLLCAFVLYIVRYMYKGVEFE